MGAAVTRSSLPFVVPGGPAAGASGVKGHTVRTAYWLADQWNSVTTSASRWASSGSPSRVTRMRWPCHLPAAAMQ